FLLEFGGLGVFSPRGDPRVLWIGLLRGAPDVETVQRQVVERLARLDVTLEDRVYRPHLTIARWRAARRSDRRRVVDHAAARTLARLIVSSVTLFESRLSPTSATHTALCRAVLAESPDPPVQSAG